jgi:hypothetical protein
MKTMKLATGICGAVLAMAALAAPAPAQVTRGTDGNGRVTTRILHPIVYDYEVAAPGAVHRRHLEILADGAATLGDTAGAKIRVFKRRLEPADLAELGAPGQPVSRMLARKLEQIAAEMAGD